MAFLVGVGQLLVLLIVLFHHTTSLPTFDRSQRHVDGLFTSELSKLRGSLSAKNYVKALLGARRSLSETSGLSTRQLGDIEFTNKYADYLKSKAKLHKITSLLKHMQNIKRSDEESFQETPEPQISPVTEEINMDVNGICLLWFQQNLLNDDSSLIGTDSDEANQLIGQFICQAVNQLVADLYQEDFYLPVNQERE
ncbi:VIP peptides-like [Acipenser ruthenus]|uniref:VIP peptides-like n=1 Tax=Acipenser ruthenus TaxID=7906 RepID=UPI00274156A7|nr:VIP peptides-like [Acipenser ruthenus]